MYLPLDQIIQQPKPQPKTSMIDVMQPNTTSAPPPTRSREGSRDRGSR
jgi:hypothetical protein